MSLGDTDCAQIYAIISKMVFMKDGDASGYAENKNNANGADGFECSLDTESVDRFMNTGVLIKASAFCWVHDALRCIRSRLVAPTRIAETRAGVFLAPFAKM